MPLTKEEVGQIAAATADEVVSRLKQQREDRELRDFIIGSAMGSGAIPLYGRETRKEPCSGCRIDLDKPLESGNVMATTEGAIGTLSTREVREWCSEIIEVADGRCERARTIREAARECKEKHPDDTEAFFRCYIPAFSQATKESNPASNPQGSSKAKPTRDNVRVEVWEERDRLHIGIQNKETGDYYVSWWDDDAREMFEQGFFKSGPELKESVLEYAEDMGILGG